MMSKGLRAAVIACAMGAALQATAPDGALFQAASQFNCLEAPGPRVVPVALELIDRLAHWLKTLTGMPAVAIEGACGECRRGDYAFDFARSIYLFNEPMRGLIHHLKYSSRVSLAKAMGHRLKECLTAEGFSAEVAVPVPLHRARVRQRGFNQAELLARQLGLHVDPRLLKRRKNTPSQTGLSRSQRELNLSAAFEVRRKPPECVVVVDDVLTTGSTVHEIAKTLKRAGTKRVEVLTVSRVP